jgi:hypothetical protein
MGTRVPPPMRSRAASESRSPMSSGCSERRRTSSRPPSAEASARRSKRWSGRPPASGEARAGGDRSQLHRAGPQPTSAARPLAGIGRLRRSGNSRDRAGPVRRAGRFRRAGLRCSRGAGRRLLRTLPAHRPDRGDGPRPSTGTLVRTNRRGHHRLIAEPVDGSDLRVCDVA